MTAKDIADQIRDSMDSGDPRVELLNRLVERAEQADRIGALAEAAIRSTGDRRYVLDELVTNIRAMLADDPGTATVILFKPSGKYYTEEEWAIPRTVRDCSKTRGDFTRAALGPWDMEHSPDFHRIDGGPVLVPEQEPWGYPWLIVGVK